MLKRVAAGILHGNTQGRFQYSHTLSFVFRDFFPAFRCHTTLPPSVLLLEVGFLYRNLKWHLEKCVCLCLAAGVDLFWNMAAGFYLEWDGNHLVGQLACSKKTWFVAGARWSDYQFRPARKQLENTDSSLTWIVAVPDHVEQLQ